MKKKTLSIALAAIFALGAVACGGGDDAGTTDGATSGTGTATEATS